MEGNELQTGIRRDVRQINFSIRSNQLRGNNKDLMDSITS